MMVMLRGSERSPLPVESPIHVDEVNKEAKRQQRQALEDRLDAYRKYMDTDEGKDALALIEPERARIDFELMLSPRELGMTVEEAGYHKAVLTGERRVWTRLLTEPDTIRRSLDRLEEGVEDKKVPKWMSVPKKVLDKFGGSVVTSASTNAASSA